MRNKAGFFIASPASQAGTARGQRPGAFYFPVPSIYQFFYFLLLLGRGLFSGLFSYWGFFKNVWKSCIAGAVVGLFCGIAGSTVTVAVLGGYSASIRGIITAFLAQTFSLSIPVANMLSEISTDILDKIPSAIITYLLVFRIPNKFLLKLPYGNKYIWGVKRDGAKAEQTK